MPVILPTDQPVNQDSATTVWGDLNSLGEPHLPLASPCDSNGWRHLYSAGSEGGDGPILVYIDAAGDGVSGSIPGLLASSMSVRHPSDSGAENVTHAGSGTASLRVALKGREVEFQDQVMALAVAADPKYANWESHRTHGVGPEAGPRHFGVGHEGADFHPTQHDSNHARQVEANARAVFDDMVARGLLQSFTGGDINQVHVGGVSYSHYDHGPYFVATTGIHQGRDDIWSDVEARSRNPLYNPANGPIGGTNSPYLPSHTNNLLNWYGNPLATNLRNDTQDPATQKSNWVNDVVYLTPPGWDGSSLTGRSPREYIGLLRCTGLDHPTLPHGAESVSVQVLIDGFGDDQIIYPSNQGVSTSEGGYAPELIFFGGSVQGIQATATVTSVGSISNITITDPGATVVSLGTAAQGEVVPGNESLESPDVILSTPTHPDWFDGFSANVSVTTDPSVIQSVYSDLNIDITEEELEERMCTNLGFADPLAQTFLVPNADSGHKGVFIHSVDLCFQSNQLPDVRVITPVPVTVELRPCTDDGGPHTTAILDMYGDRAQVSRTIPDAEIYTGYLSGALPSFNNNNFSRFKFQSPIWLEAGTMYAVVVRSNESAYRLWINDVEGEKRQIVSGSIQGAVADGVGGIPGKTQYAGALFKSQNGRSWNENPYQDLMFRINRCRFTQSAGSVEIRAGDIGGESKDKVFDRAMLNTMPGDGTIIPVPGKDSVSYSFTPIDESSVSTPLSQFDVEIMENMPKRMKLRTSSEHGDFKVDVALSSTGSDISSPVIDFRNWTFKTIKNHINNGELSNTNISFDGGVGAGYTKGDQLNVYGGGATTNAVIEVVTVSSDVQAIETAKISTPGLGFHKNATVNNTPFTGGTPGTLAGITINGEEGVGGGNARFKYITRPVVLAPGMDATNIRAYITAFKPEGSQIYLYYKVLAQEDSETLDDKSWKIMRQILPDVGYHNSDDRIEIEFDAGDEDITYTGSDGTSTYRNFKTFAVKLVGFADNPAKVPVISNLRAIAVT